MNTIHIHIKGFEIERSLSKKLQALNDCKQPLRLDFNIHIKPAHGNKAKERVIKEHILIAQEAFSFETDFWHVKKSMTIEVAFDQAIHFHATLSAADAAANAFLQVPIQSSPQILHAPFPSAPDVLFGEPEKFVLHFQTENPDRPWHMQRTTPRSSTTHIARDHKATVQLPTDCFSFSPSSNNTLVINQIEYEPPVHRFENYQDDTQVFHDKRPKVAGAPKCRMLENINAIVLHETTGYRLNNPKHAPGKWKRGDKNSAHFVVHSDGSIAQCFDPYQALGHTQGYNSRSIGIEFANKVWFEDSEEQFSPGQIKPYEQWEKNHHDDSFSIRSWEARSPEDSGKENRRYSVPTLAALLALEALFDALLKHFDIPEDYTPMFLKQGDARAVPMYTKAGQELMHKAKQAGTESELKTLFLMTRHKEFEFVTIAKGNKNVKKKFTFQIEKPPGVYHHYSIGPKHTDGSFQCLYLWLRRKQSKSPEQARMIAVHMLKTPWASEKSLWSGESWQSKTLEKFVKQKDGTWEKEQYKPSYRPRYLDVTHFSSNTDFADLEAW